MTRKYFEAYYKAITTNERKALHEAAGEHFKRATETMRKKFIGQIEVDNAEILFAIKWIRDNCPITVEEVDEQLSHDQTTDDKLSQFHQKVIENREQRIQQEAETA